jgi:F420-dependent oxidoreductase-like protein
MRLALMVEGQEDVSWEQWLALARTCEESGVEALFRSDHYASVVGAAARGSLDAWATIAALAAVTEHLRLGTMVSPATFRHPSVLAKAAATADHVSGGRVELGLGTGWHEGEHRAYGFDFPDLATRLEVFAEQLELVHRQWTEDEVSFAGRHYRLEGCRALPKPVQEPHPPIVVGGRALRGTADPAARFADEYNTVFPPRSALGARRRRLVEACERAGRDPGTLRYSVMTRVVVGADRAELLERTRRSLAVTGEETGPEDALARNADVWIAGTVDEVVVRMREYAQAGVERVYCQHLDHADVEMVRLLGREVAPAVATA